MEVVELHRRTIEEFLQAVRSIHSDAWPGPTPCTDWDLRALVNHVVAEDRWTVPLCRGATLPVEKEAAYAQTRPLIEAASQGTESLPNPGRFKHLPAAGQRVVAQGAGRLVVGQAG